MDIGMMWLDDAKNRTIEEKISRAAAYYQQKYGRKPDFCLINEGSFVEGLNLEQIDVRPAKHIRPAHFLIGCQPT